MTEHTHPDAPRLYLIDGSAYVHRAFHALPPLATGRGLPTNAVLGFARMLVRLLREQAASHVVCVFDAPGKTFRSELYPEYKSHRPPLPDDLRTQLPYIRRLVRALRVAVVEVAGVEADDVIGTLAVQAERAGIDTTIVSADKDLMQLVGPRVELYDEMRDRRIGVDEVADRFGVAPARVPDVLGLTGDASDGIPGVAGIGAKTAAALVAALGSVDDILAHPAAVEALPIRGAKRVRERLEAGAEVARLSRALATIKLDVPVHLDLEQTRWPGPDRDELEALLRELEFTSLLEEMVPARPTTAAVEHRVADDARSWRALATRLRRSGRVVVTTLFGSSRRTVAPIEMMAFQGDDGVVEVVPAPEQGALDVVADVFADMAVMKIGGDLKGLRVALVRRRHALVGPLFDVELASYCLDPSRATHEASAVAQDLLGQRVQPGGDAAARIAASAAAARALVPELEARLEHNQASALFRTVETPLAMVLADMELAGIRVDAAALATQAAAVERELDVLLRDIHDLAGTTFNVNSPVQLRAVLFERLGLPTRGVRRSKTGLSTDVDVLTKLARHHPLPARILEYRMRSKLKSTYLDALPALIDPLTGRIHTSFNQTVTATGRLSSSDPNLQNIPVRSDEGRRIRRAFVAAEGCQLVSADYSQIELRLLAHLSGDETLIEAFRADQDVHARTAAEVFATLAPAEGRRLAKVINYGILYGMGPARAARELGVGVREASAYIRGYFERHPRVRAFLDDTVARGRTQGYVSTLLGRRRPLPELASQEPSVRQFAERAAVNTPVQGSAADLIKLAMLDVHRRLGAACPGAAMVLQVHDELLVEVPSGQADEVAELVRTAMEQVWDLAVPLRVDVRVGRSWADIH